LDGGSAQLKVSNNKMKSGYRFSSLAATPVFSLAEVKLYRLAYTEKHLQIYATQLSNSSNVLQDNKAELMS
jgi:hypothetical protein